MRSLLLCYILDALCVAVYFLQCLLCSGDNIVLCFFGKNVEEGAVAGNADDKVLMIFGVQLGVNERFAGDDVILHMISVKSVEKRADEHFELLPVLFGREHLWRHLLIEQDAAGDLIGAELGDGFKHGGRAVFVRIVRRAAAFGKRLMGVSAVRRGHGAETLPDIGAD